ncbi:MAG: hypothetical protein Q8P80_05065 [Candidatus Levybacteria bacterium]|nr:hypothetical protein [Candidatus Levybacteria bacterium]
MDINQNQQNPQQITSEPEKPKKYFKKIIILTIAFLFFIIIFSAFRNNNIEFVRVIVQHWKGVGSQNIDETTKWKTYINKEWLYSFSYPDEWKNGENGGNPTFGINKPMLDVMVWAEGKDFAKSKSIEPACANYGEGCAALPNKEVKEFTINGNTVFLQVAGGGTIHAYIPSEKRNITVELYSTYLNKKSFDKILQTFKFLDNNGDESSTWENYTSTKVPGNIAEVYSIKYPSGWLKQSRHDDLSDFLSLSKKEHIIFIKQATFGGYACYFADSTPPEDSSRDLIKDFVNIETPFQNLRRFVNPSSSYDNYITFNFCGKEENYYYPSTKIGVIQYKAPKTYDKNIIEEMDSILKTAQVIK